METKQWQEPEPPPADRPPPEKKGRPWIPALLLLPVAAFLVWFFGYRSGNPPDDSPSAEDRVEIQEEIVSPQDSGKTAVEEKPGSAIVPLSVPLSQSDEALRARASSISGHARISSLLQEQDIIRRFVAAVNAVAIGESPARLLEPLAPRTAFEALRRGGSFELAPASYRRYDETVELLLSLDPQTCSDLYLSFEAQIEEAYRELGQPQPASFRDVLNSAARQILHTPPPPDRIELIEKTVSYAFADPKLEELNDAQKLFMRLGPFNLRQLQGKITLLLDALRQSEKNREPQRN